ANRYRICRTYRATDLCGNTSTCTQTIVVGDETPPVITCPADRQLQCGESSNPSNTGSATATDSCSGGVTITHSDALLPPDCTGQHGIDRTWTATDACGNHSSCVQHITFVDRTAPVVNCPPDRQLQCGDSTDPSNTGTATASDNCGGVTTITSSDLTT